MFSADKKEERNNVLNTYLLNKYWSVVLLKHNYANFLF